MTITPFEKYKLLTREEPVLFSNAAGSPLMILPPNEAVSGVFYDDDYIRVLRDHVRFSASGAERGYFRVLPAKGRTRGVVCLPRLRDQFLLVRSFRHATRSFHVEVPRGLGEPGASAAVNVSRETWEEIGRYPNKLTSLGLLHADTGTFGASVEMFLAELDGPPTKGPEADTDVVAFTREELELAIAGGEITDSFTIAAWARARLRSEF